MASVYCHACKAQLCRDCNIIEHSTRILKTHVRTDLNDMRYRCATHDLETRFVCLDDNV